MQLNNSVFINFGPLKAFNRLILYWRGTVFSISQIYWTKGLVWLYSMEHSLAVDDMMEDKKMYLGYQQMRKFSFSECAHF